MAEEKKTKWPEVVDKVDAGFCVVRVPDCARACVRAWLTYTIAGRVRATPKADRLTDHLNEPTDSFTYRPTLIRCSCLQDGEEAKSIILAERPNLRVSSSVLECVHACMHVGTRICGAEWLALLYIPSFLPFSPYRFIIIIITR